MKKLIDDRLRAYELKMFIHEVNYRRIKQGKRKLTSNEIGKYLIKGKSDVLLNELIQI